VGKPVLKGPAVTRMPTSLLLPHDVKIYTAESFVFVPGDIIHDVHGINNTFGIVVGTASVGDYVLVLWTSRLTFGGELQ
jgi:hypothetical protein